MNMLLFALDEIDGEGLLAVRGERATHIRSVLRLTKGDSLRIGLREKGMGTGTIEEDTGDAIVIRPGVLADEAPLPERELIVALPRPQSLKKILQAASMLGVRRLFLISSDRTEKSYFSSTLLRDENIWEHVRLGLEQGVSTRAPEVLVLSERKPRKSAGFARWIEETFPREQCVRCVAHVPGGGSAAPSLGGIIRGGAEHAAVFAIGPEGGWTDGEAEAFLSSGFRPFQLGPRILRVELAVLAVLAQHDLLRIEQDGESAGGRD